jgi:predicted DNA-binding transcriptional regulator AlpA
LSDTMGPSPIYGFRRGNGASKLKPKHAPPTQHSRCFYDEDEVQRWIACQLRGEVWRPAPVASEQRRRLISRRQMLNRVPLSYPSIWRIERAGLFPQPIRIVPLTILAHGTDP